METEKRCHVCKIAVPPSWARCPFDGASLGSPTDPESTTNGSSIDDVLDLITKRLQLPGKRTLEQSVAGLKRKCPLCQEVYPGTAKFCSNDSSPLETIAIEELIGQILNGSYQVQSLVGEGGSSKVYKGKHVFLGRTVAIKVLRSNQITEGTVKRFLQESRAVSSLNHQNIVILHDFGITSDGRPYLVMDFVEGQTLYQLIKAGGRLDHNRVIKLFRQVSEALHHAHLKGIIHRDVKPANMVLTGGNEQVKLLDFGLAKIMSWSNMESLEATVEGFIFGSPLYMSPEQCLNKPVDIRSDIYSLGVSMFEALTGKPPFRGDSVPSILLKHINDQPPSVKDELKGVGVIPDELDGLICRCLAKDPSNRYQSMAEIIDQLDALLGVKAVRKPSLVEKPRNNKLTILIVDDEEVTLLACALALKKQADFEVIGVAINGELAVEKVAELRPDVVIMDYQLPMINGGAATRAIKENYPETKVLILSSHQDRQTVLDAFAAGANGYALKSLPGERLFLSIRTIAVGSLWIDDGIDEKIVYEAREMVYSMFKNKKVLPLPGTLSVIELKLLKLLLEGASDEDLCARLSIGQDILWSHKQGLLRMLNAISN